MMNHWIKTVCLCAAVLAASCAPREKGFEIRGIRSGSYLCFQNVNNMRQNALMHMRLANGNDAPCAVEIRENSPFGPVLGCVRAENPGDLHPFGFFHRRI